LTWDYILSCCQINTTNLLHNYMYATTHISS